MECRPTRHPLTVIDRSVAHPTTGTLAHVDRNAAAGWEMLRLGPASSAKSLCSSRTRARRGVQRIGSTGSGVRSSTPGCRYEPQVSAGKR